MAGAVTNQLPSRPGHGRLQTSAAGRNKPDSVCRDSWAALAWPGWPEPAVAAIASPLRRSVVRRWLDDRCSAPQLGRCGTNCGFCQVRRQGSRHRLGAISHRHSSGMVRLSGRPAAFPWLVAGGLAAPCLTCNRTSICPKGTSPTFPRCSPLQCQRDGGQGSLPSPLYSRLTRPLRPR